MGRARLDVAQQQLFDAVPFVDRGIQEAKDASLHPSSRLEQPRISRLLRLALSLGAADVGGPLTNAESGLVEQIQNLPASSPSQIEEARHAIVSGDDPLGDELCDAWPAAERRLAGAFYTQPDIVRPMVDWALAQSPCRLIDPGCGSGRFAAEAIRRNPNLHIVAIDLDPVATLLTRATLSALEVDSATVLQADYTDITLAAIEGKTAYVGNPPYVRHHDLSAVAKAWMVRTARSFGHKTTALAGLHAHFYLATAKHAKAGDIGCFVTSAEWLDVNYGSVIRELLLNGLGGLSLHVIDPRTAPFADAMTTAAITTFEVGASPDALRFQYVEGVGGLQSLDRGIQIERATLTRTNRWSPLLHETGMHSDQRQGVPLRRIARVHRGVVTGANHFFVMSRDRAKELGIEQWCRPAVTSGKELFNRDGILRDGPNWRLLLDVPSDVDRSASPELDAYLREGETSQGGKPAVADGYIASRRRPWWFLGRQKPPPIVASYMARQAPTFALNPDGLAIINIAHGIYPSTALSPEQLAALVTTLNAIRESFRGSGRTYHGGLEKFEPREMESLLIPSALVDVDVVGS